MNPDKIFDQIKQWHLQRNASELEGYFTLGDMLLNAAIATSLHVTKVVKRVKLMMGELACSDTRYRRAIRFARTYTANQRKVLLDKCVSVNRVDKLATEYYTGKKRVEIIAHIKAGNIKNWSTISTPREQANLKATASLRAGLSHPERVVVIDVYSGHDKMYDGVRSLLTLTKQEELIKVMNQAVDACIKSGLKLRHWKLA